jgi:hypothetical protein
MARIGSLGSAGVEQFLTHRAAGRKADTRPRHAGGLLETAQGSPHSPPVNVDSEAFQNG